jgi:hypothetical protein
MCPRNMHKSHPHLDLFIRFNYTYEFQRIANKFVRLGGGDELCFRKLPRIADKSSAVCGLLVAGGELKGFLYLSATLRCAYGQL